MEGLSPHTELINLPDSNTGGSEIERKRKGDIREWKVKDPTRLRPILWWGILDPIQNSAMGIQISLRRSRISRPSSAEIWTHFHTSHLPTHQPTLRPPGRRDRPSLFAVASPSSFVQVRRRRRGQPTDEGNSGSERYPHLRFLIHSVWVFDLLFISINFREVFFAPTYKWETYYCMYIVVVPKTEKAIGFCLACVRRLNLYLRMMGKPVSSKYPPRRTKFVPWTLVNGLRHPPYSMLVYVRDSARARLSTYASNVSHMWSSSRASHWRK